MRTKTVIAKMLIGFPVNRRWRPVGWERSAMTEESEICIRVTSRPHTLLRSRLVHYGDSAFAAWNSRGNLQNENVRWNKKNIYIYIYYYQVTRVVELKDCFVLTTEWLIVSSISSESFYFIFSLWLYFRRVIEIHRLIERFD